MKRLRNSEGLPGDQKDCTKILGNPQIARKHPPELPQNRHPFAIGQGSECNPPKTVAMPAQSFPGNCGVIADSRRSKGNSVSSHPRGQQITINPELALFFKPFQIAAQHNQTGLQLDCRTKKVCNVIDLIALRLHGLQVNCGNCKSHRGTETSNPLNLLQSPHTDCISILPPVT